jgi:DNA-binding IscR family transcriptional regulator
MTNGPSLKTVLQTLAGSTGTHWSLLYEHQKYLVREGLLHSRPGKGPGSGVLATPEAISIFFLTFAARRSPRDLVDIEKAVIARTRVVSALEKQS